ncbi:MAG TPA: HAD-IB family phosphatase [Thermoplasmata archaeon]|nr:HAD-IB family phosphatase [Thermoplasmata archaeon]
MEPAPSPLRMFIDFDGTLVEPNVAILLVEQFATDGARVAREVDEQLHSGQITLREAWRRQVALLPADRLDEMAAWAVAHAPLREGATELLSLLAKHRVPTAILSGGLDFYIHPVLRHAGLALPVYSDVLKLEAGARTAVLEHPYGHPSCRLCGICKAQTIRGSANERTYVAFAGDGSTDRYAAEVADLLFARRRLRGYCDRSGIPYYPFDDFRPVTARLAGWLEGTEPWPVRRGVGLAASDCPISRELAEVVGRPSAGVTA